MHLGKHKKSAQFDKTALKISVQNNKQCIEFFERLETLNINFKQSQKFNVFNCYNFIYIK